MADLKGRVGLRRLKDGAMDFLRLSPGGGVVSIQGAASFQEAVRNGNCYVAETAATGVAPGTSVSTTHAFTLYNPVGSGVNLVVWRASVGYVSGTLGAGVIHYVGPTPGNATAVTFSAAITPVNLLLNNARSATGRPGTTATVPANPLVLRPFGSMGASLASTAVQPWMLTENVDGEFVVTPGGYLSLHSTAAGGSTPLVVIGMSWEEVPV